jgi:ATP synthase protein I
MRNVLIVQIFLVLIAAALCGWFFDSSTVRAALYGGFIAMANTLLSLRHLHRAERIAGEVAEQNVRIFYQCAFERLVITLALFALGLGILKLEPLAVIGGFILGQIALFLDLQKKP